MGCDISLVVERRRDGSWERAESWVRDRRWRPGAETPEFIREEWYGLRNYVLFAILAGVRNYVGLAPIAEPRGLPADVSEEAAEELMGAMSHSFSWLTLRELLDYDWSAEFAQEGLVPLDVYAQWRADGSRTPLMWCRAVSVPGRVVLDEQEAAAWLAAGARGTSGRLFDSVLVRAVWKRKRSDAAGDFYDELIPRLATVGAPDDVRIVFSFDN